MERKTDLRVIKTRKAIKDTSYQEFSDKFFMAMLQHNRARHNPYANFSQEEQNITNTFLAISSVNLYRQWVNDTKSFP